MWRRRRSVTLRRGKLIQLYELVAVCVRKQLSTVDERHAGVTCAYGTYAERTVSSATTNFRCEVLSNKTPALCGMRQL